MQLKVAILPTHQFVTAFAVAGYPGGQSTISKLPMANNLVQMSTLMLASTAMGEVAIFGKVRCLPSLVVMNNQAVWSIQASRIQRVYSTAWNASCCWKMASPCALTLSTH